MWTSWAIPVTLVNGTVRLVPRGLRAATDVWLDDLQLGIVCGSGDDECNRRSCHRKIEKVLRHFQRHPADAFQVTVFADRHMGWTSAYVRLLRRMSSEDAEGRVVITRSGLEDTVERRLPPMQTQTAHSSTAVQPVASMNLEPDTALFAYNQAMVPKSICAQSNNKIPDSAQEETYGTASAAAEHKLHGQQTIIEYMQQLRLDTERVVDAKAEIAWEAEWTVDPTE